MAGLCSLVLDETCITPGKCGAKPRYVESRISAPLYWEYAAMRNCCTCATKAIQLVFLHRALLRSSMR